MTVDHRLSHEAAVHTAWDNGLDPALTVESGDVVRFNCHHANGSRLTPETESADLPDVEFVGHWLTGPVAVRGARPGDVLQVEFRDVEHDDWGYTLIRRGEKGAGLLPEDFPDPFLYHWKLDDEIGYFEEGIEVPLDPFPGVAGVAPETDGEHPTSPPRDVGGNLDIKHLTSGSTLYLPVAVEDALFSIGDGHAAQGDGEVCISPIETAIRTTVEFTVRTDISIDQPHFETTGPFTPTGRDERMYATTGIGDDLMEASKAAVRAMIERLHDWRGLSRTEAYALCSVAADLKINEVVNDPNWVVSAYMAESIFPDRS
jgi:acetamidase/formamidase